MTFTRQHQRWTFSISACLAVTIVLFFFGKTFLSAPTEAAGLSSVSDLIVSSIPATSTNHTITFSISSTIPASGKVIITPESGFFTIPGAFDVTDVDFATSSSVAGPYVDRSLAATPSAGNDGVSVITGTAGSITITLNSTQGVSVGAFIQIELGMNATFGTGGDARLINPSSTASYKIYIETRNASDVLLNRGQARIAIVAPVVATAIRELDVNPPVRSNASPSGNVPANITAVELSLNTNEAATCRYATTASTSYDAMTTTFSNTGATLHMTNAFGLSQGTQNFYVRCKDQLNNKNPDDFAITFTIPAPAPPPAPPAAAGFGIFPAFPPAPEVIFLGTAYSNSKVSILKDGVFMRDVRADPRGLFSMNVSVAQGTFTFGVVGEDSAGRKSLVFNSTLSIIAGTKSTVSNIFLSPTVALEKAAVNPGEPLVIFGESAPSSTVEAWVYPQSITNVNESTAVKTFASADATNGKYILSIDTSDFSVNTYALKVRTSLNSLTSNFGSLVYFGVGQEPSLDFGVRSDINGDNKINLVDFSILLFHWGSGNVTADINFDGIVNLTDFSIMLFRWTG